MLSAEEIGPPVSNDLRVLTDSINPNYELILGSGCSQHMFNSCRNLSNFISFAPNEISVVVANGRGVPVQGFGTYGILSRVYFVPSLSHCLLSVNALTDEGIVILFNNDYAILHKGESELMEYVICSQLKK